jgi:hypothetical protein
MPNPLPCRAIAARCHSEEPPCCPFSPGPQVAGSVAVGLAAVVLSACVATGPGTVPPGQSGGSVQVALLVPSGSGQSQDELFGANLENAARLAMADLGVNIDLRVYKTGGSPAQAAALAKQAVDRRRAGDPGAVLFPRGQCRGRRRGEFRRERAGLLEQRRHRGRQRLRPGPDLRHTARRLANYAVRNGKSKVLIVHDRNVAGEVGKAAIDRGVASAGGLGRGLSTSYEFSQNGIVQAASGIVSTAQSSGATALFLTADTAGALPLAQPASVDNGIDPHRPVHRPDPLGHTARHAGAAERAGRLVRHAGPRPAGPVPSRATQAPTAASRCRSPALPMTGSRPSARWPTGPRAGAGLDQGRPDTIGGLCRGLGHLPAARRTAPTSAALPWRRSGRARSS